MVYVYILRSQKSGRYYVGSTIDVIRRLKEHQSGKVYATQKLTPLELVFRQQFVNLKTARQVESRIKKLKSRNIIEKIIREGIIKCASSSDG